MNKFHVVIIHDKPIPALKYGGTERVVWWLGEALHALGHKVTYIVPKGSLCSFADVVIRGDERQSLNALIPPDASIIHTTFTPREKFSKPLIITISGNGKTGEKFHPNTVFVSKNHAKRHGSNFFVYNGINPEEYPPLKSEKKENFSYFLAKAKWKVKNVEGAIEIAKNANVPLRIMGGWKFSIGKRVKWLGMLGGEKKKEVLRNGSALIFPVRWHEPFGIAIIEALFTGSPVYGTPYGSLPELVKEEYGYLSNQSKLLSQALKKHDQYDPQACRKYVLDNFTHITMANKYLEYYEHIIKGKELSPCETKTLSKNHPEMLLEFY